MKTKPYPDEWQLLRDLHPTLGKKGSLYFDRDRVEILYWNTRSQYQGVQFGTVRKLMNLGYLEPHPDGFCQWDITQEGMAAVESREKTRTNFVPEDNQNQNED